MRLPDEFPHRVHFHHPERLEDGPSEIQRLHGGAACRVIQESRRDVKRVVVRPLQVPHDIDEGLLWARADW